MSEMPQALEKFLETQPAEPLSPELRKAMLAATLARLPKRRWGPWPMVSAIAAGIAAAFVAGYLLGRIDEREQAPLPKQEHAEHALVPTPKEIPKSHEGPVANAKVPRPIDVEWQAFDTADNKERVRLYLQAGDLYLAQHQDWHAALRCYRQALTDCDSHDLEVTSQDNFLVTAMKLDYRKEK